MRRLKRKDLDRVPEKLAVEIEELKLPSKRAGSPLTNASVLSAQDDRPLVDRFGHRHSMAILEAWSPRMVSIMQIRTIPSHGEVIAEAKPLASLACDGVTPRRRKP